MCMCIFACVCLHVCVAVYVCISVFVCTFMSVCVYSVFMCVCVYLHMCIFVCLSVWKERRLWASVLRALVLPLNHQPFPACLLLFVGMYEVQASHTLSHPLALSPALGTCSPVAAPVSQMSLPPPACVSEEPKAWPVFVITMSEDPFFSLFGPLESLGCILLLSMAHCSALRSSVRSCLEPGTRCWGREQMWALPLWSLQSLGEIHTYWWISSKMSHCYLC